MQRITSTHLFRRLLVFFVLITHFVCLIAQEPSAIDIIHKAEKRSNSRIGIEVRRCSDNDLIVSNRRMEQFCPASLTKLVTSATMLRLYDPYMSFSTTLWADGSIENGILKGNLVLKGGGDPSLVSRYFPLDSGRFSLALLDAVKYWGINTIIGDIIVDASVFDQEGVNPTWMDEDKGNYYGAGVYGFNINDNRIDVILSTGKARKKAQILRIEPPHPEVEWDNQIKAVRKRRDTASSFGLGLNPRRTLNGVLPAHLSFYRLKTDLPNPALYGSIWMKNTLLNAGISCEGRTIASYQPVSSSKELLIYESLPLDSLIHAMNFYSLNHFAEAFVKHLSFFSSTDQGVKNTTNRGLDVLHHYWQSQLGLQESDLLLYDGSGLSRRGRFSPYALSQILNDMIFGAGNESFLASLPRAGEEGSVKNFLKGKAIEAYLKSGSMRGVLGYAGYVYYHNDWYSVVLIGNDFSSSAYMRRVFSDFLLSLFP